MFPRQIPSLPSCKLSVCSECGAFNLPYSQEPDPKICPICHPDKLFEFLKDKGADEYCVQNCSAKARINSSYHLMLFESGFDAYDLVRLLDTLYDEFQKNIYPPNTFFGFGIISENIVVLKPYDFHYNQTSNMQGISDSDEVPPKKDSCVHAIEFGFVEDGKTNVSFILPIQSYISGGIQTKEHGSNCSTEFHNLICSAQGLIKRRAFTNETLQNLSKITVNYSITSTTLFYYSDQDWSIPPNMPLNLHCIHACPDEGSQIDETGLAQTSVSYQCFPIKSILNFIPTHLENLKDTISVPFDFKIFTNPRFLSITLEEMVAVKVVQKKPDPIHRKKLTMYTFNHQPKQNLIRLLIEPQVNYQNAETDKNKPGIPLQFIFGPPPGIVYYTMAYANPSLND